MFILSFYLFIVSSEIYVKSECPPIVRKNEWGGANPQFVQYLSPPVDLIVIQHTVTQTCSNDKDCIDIVKDIQKIHVEDALLADIGPSFLIGGNGKVYEGRGWNRIAIHTYGYNNQSIGIAFIGNFNNHEPSRGALEAARALIQCGIEDNRLTTDHSVVVHKQLIPTESPGKKLASKIMSWPDWVQDVTEIKKRAATLENLRETKNVALSSTTAPVTTTTSKPTTETQVNIEDRFLVLTTPKQIDLLASTRDIITEFINNLRELSLQLLKTVGSLGRGIKNQIRETIDKHISILNRGMGEINVSILMATQMTMFPISSECIQSLRKESYEIYNQTKNDMRTCADKKVKELDDLIKSLEALANKALETSNNAAEDARNCTELNIGILKPTEDCLSSVSRRTQNAITNFQKQKALGLTTFQTTGDSITSTMEQCAKEYFKEANMKALQFSFSINRCTHIVENPATNKVNIFKP